MSDSPITTSSLEESSLVLSVPLPLTKHPAHVYLTSLGQGSRPTMRGSLNEIASMLTAGKCEAMTLDWSKLRYHHTAAVRAVLTGLRQISSPNKAQSGFVRHEYVMMVVQPLYETERHGCAKSL